MCQSFFYNCSRQYVDSVSPDVCKEISEVISQLEKRETQSEINTDFFKLLTERGWSFDCIPSGHDRFIRNDNVRNLCLTSTTLEAKWHCDFAKEFNGKLVQIEIQFGKVEAMFKDFCGFRIAWHERRLSLGIEIVMYDPGQYFSHRKSSISGMAYFEIAKKTLPAIGLDCPIWLIGIMLG